MTRDDLDTLTQRYLQLSFDDIETNLALDWKPEGLPKRGVNRPDLATHSRNFSPHHWRH